MGQYTEAFLFSNLWLLTELIRDELLKIGEQELKKDSPDISWIITIYKKAEKTITPGKLVHLANQLEPCGETEFHKGILELSDYLRSIVGDRFRLIKENQKHKLNRLFFDLKWYFDKVEQEKEERNKGKENNQGLRESKKRALGFIKKDFKLNNDEMIERVLDSFSYYKGSHSLSQVGRMALEQGNYGDAIEALTLAEDRIPLLQKGRELLEQKEYYQADRLLKNYSSETASQLIKEKLKDDLLGTIKTDLKAGLEFLTTLLNNEKLKSKFNIRVQEQFQPGGHKSQVTVVMIQSELLPDFQMAIKVDKQSQRFENKMYKLIKDQDIEIPRLIKSGKIGTYYLSVLEYMPGDPLGETTINKKLLKKIIAITKQLQVILSKRLSQKEKGKLPNDEFNKGSYYSKRIQRVLKANMNITLAPTALKKLDFYLEQERLTVHKTISTDRHTRNFIYNPGNHKLGGVDFNNLKNEYPQEDWTLFIDDPQLKTRMSPEELLKEYIQYNRCDSLTDAEQEKIYHYIAVYKNLILAVKKFSLKKDLHACRHHLLRAKKSAIKVNLICLVEEIDKKIIPLLNIRAN